MENITENTVVENKRVLDLLFSYMPKIAAERKMDNLTAVPCGLPMKIVGNFGRRSLMG